MPNLKYFKPYEFQECVPACRIEDMQDVLLVALDELREYCGFPIHLNSAYRSYEYEISNGRSGTSSHCKGLAVDIRCVDDAQRDAILSFVYYYGPSYKDISFRVGIAKTYLHLDLDDTKPLVCWVY